MIMKLRRNIMSKVSIKQIYRSIEKYQDTSIQISGWVRSNRAQKQFGFLMVNDGSFFESAQIVYDQELTNFKDVQKYRVGSAITIVGNVVLTPNAKQPFEIKATDIVLEGDSPEDYPIQPKR